jgi:hypothetical protein
MKKLLLFGLVLIMLCSVAFASLDTDVVSYYKMDEISGTTAVDSAGNYNGTANNARVFTSEVAGQINTGLDLTQGNDYLTAGSASNWKFLHDGSSWTISHWLKLPTPNAGGRYFLFETANFGSSSIGLDFLYTDLSSNTRKIQIYVNRGVGGQSAIVLDANNVYPDSTGWVHVVAVHDGSLGSNQLKLYIDGELAAQASKAYDYSTSNPTNTLNIGRTPADGSSNFLHGSIDEISIWNRALSSDEVVSLRNIQKDGFESGQYPFPTNFTITAKTYGSTQLKDFNVSIDGTPFTAINGSHVSNIDDSQIVDINIISNSNNVYLNQTFLSWNTSVDLVFNYSVLNITAKNNRTSETIDTFTASFTKDEQEYSINESTLFFLKPELTEITVASIGFANHTFQITPILGLNSYEASMFAANSLLINIFNVTNGVVLTQLVDIQAELGDVITLYNTSTGEMFLNLTAGEYRFTFMSEGFQNTYYVATVGNDSFQILDVYMSEIEEETVVFTFKDRVTGSTIEGATLHIKRLIGNTWVTINALKSDISGKVTFSYIPHLRYKFTVTANEYATRDFELNPIIFSSYNVLLDKAVEFSTPDYQRVSIAYTPKQFPDNKINEIVFNFASGTGSLEFYGFNVTYKNESTGQSGSNAYGSTLNANINISGATFGDKVYVSYFYQFSDGERVDRTDVYHIVDIDSPDLTFIRVGEHYGLGFFERTLIMVFLMVVVGGASFIFGGLISSGVSVLILLGYFIKISFLSAWILIPTMILIGVAVAWRATQ